MLINLYTTNGTIPFGINETDDKFKEMLIDAMSKGSVVIDTIEDTQLVINFANVVAVEIAPLHLEKEGTNNEPRGGTL